MIEKMQPNYLHAGFAEIHEKINEIIDEMGKMNTPPEKPVVVKASQEKKPRGKTRKA